LSTHDNSYYESLHASLDELRSLCLSLKSENKELKERVKLLQKQVETGSTQKNQNGTDLTDVEIIAIRNQISSHIKRIDQILETE
jgi:hypothetical protein